MSNEAALRREPGPRAAPACQAGRGASHIAVFISELTSGGVQKRMLDLAGGLTARGHRVDLVLCRVDGRLSEQVPEGVSVVGLKAGPGWLGRIYALAADPKGFLSLLRPVLLPRKPSETLPYLPDLVRYLRRVRPRALLAAKPHPNVEASWARRLAHVGTRLVVSERISLAGKTEKSRMWKRRFLPPLVRRSYLNADAIVAVSDGVADDLADTARIPRDRITTIYNPVVTPQLLKRAEEPLDHPWFAAGAPPVLLGVGRLHDDKDFPTLIRAFARVRKVREARLMILGEAKRAERLDQLKALADELGVAQDVDFPGFVKNPLAYMAKASIFVLSSIWEGLPGVMIEALACGCPVASTDCPSGPAEILENGLYGPLVPVGDDAALAEAILSTLENPPDREELRARGATFSLDRAVDRYLEVLLDAT